MYVQQYYIVLEHTPVQGKCLLNVEWSEEDMDCEKLGHDYKIDVDVSFMFNCYGATSCETFDNPYSYYRNCATPDDSIVISSAKIQRLYLRIYVSV